jgi:hypothetical protein
LWHAVCGKFKKKIPIIIISDGETPCIQSPRKFQRRNRGFGMGEFDGLREGILIHRIINLISN